MFDKLFVKSHRNKVLIQSFSMIPANEFVYLSNIFLRKVTGVLEVQLGFSHPQS